MSLNKLSSKRIYYILIESSNSKPSSQMYTKNVFQNSNLDWKAIYMLPCVVTKDSRLRVFQYKLLNNVLYLNKMLFMILKIDSRLCSFFKMIDETSLHFFYNCTKIKHFCDRLKEFISYETLSFPSLTPQKAINIVKWSYPRRFLKSQGKLFLSFPCTLFYIFLTPKNYKLSL